MKTPPSSLIFRSQPRSSVLSSCVGSASDPPSNYQTGGRPCKSTAGFMELGSMLDRRRAWILDQPSGTSAAHRHRATAQHHQPAAAEAADEIALRLDLIGAMAAELVVESSRDEQALRRTRQRP